MSSVVTVEKAQAKKHLLILITNLYDLRNFMLGSDLTFSWRLEKYKEISF